MISARAAREDSPTFKVLRTKKREERQRDTLPLWLKLLLSFFDGFYHCRLGAFFGFLDRNVSAGACISSSS